MAQYTITFSERNKGWTSFWSYIPDWFSRLNNRFFSIKNGQVWEHNDVDNPVMNNFYGAQYSSSIKTVFNDDMIHDKAFKTLVLESPEKWDAAILTNYTESSIESDKFNTRESRQFAFVRQNEDTEDLRGGVAQGIGVIVSATGLTITFSRDPELVNIGDVLKQRNGGTNEVIGTITDITSNVVTVDAIVTTPVPGFFSFAQKNARAEGSDVRGYFMEVLLSNTETTQSGIFAVGTETSRSYV